MDPTDKVSLYVNDVFSAYRADKVRMSSQFLFNTDVNMLEELHNNMKAKDDTFELKGLHEQFEVALIPSDAPPVDISLKSSVEFIKRKGYHNINVRIPGRRRTMAGRIADKYKPTLCVTDKSKAESSPQRSMRVYHRDIILYKERPDEMSVEILFRKGDVGKIKNYYHERFMFYSTQRAQCFYNVMARFPRLTSSSSSPGEIDLKVPTFLHQEAINKIFGENTIAEILAKEPENNESITLHKNIQLEKLEQIIVEHDCPLLIKRVILFHHHEIYKVSKTGKTLYTTLEEKFKHGDLKKKLYILNIIQEWMTCYFQDFVVISDKVFTSDNPEEQWFLSQVLSSGSTIMEIIKLQRELRLQLQKDREMFKIREKTLQQQSQQKDTKQKNRTYRVKVEALLRGTSIDQYTPLELALMMYHYDAERVLKINVRELANGKWKKNGKEEIAPNILQVIEDGENRCWWACSQIMAQKSRAKRTKILRLIINTCYECYVIGNWYAASSLILALQKPFILRLKLTWKGLDIDTIKKKMFVNSMLETDKYKEFYNNRQLDFHKIPLPHDAMELSDSHRNNWNAPCYIHSGRGRRSSFMIGGQAHLRARATLGDMTNTNVVKHNVKLQEIPDFRIFLNDLYKISEYSDKTQGMINFDTYVRYWNLIRKYLLLCQVGIKKNRKEQPFKVDNEILKQYKKDLEFCLIAEELFILSYLHEKSKMRCKHCQLRGEHKEGCPKRAINAMCIECGERNSHAINCKRKTKKPM